MENQNGMCLAHRERQMLGIPLIRNWSIPPDFSDGGTTMSARDNKGKIETKRRGAS
jgi:hypothetical protein